MNRFRWIGGIFLAAVGILGLGNGVWNYFTEPALLKGSHWLLNTISLGYASYKDHIYADAANGPHEHVANEIIKLLFLFLLILPPVLLSYTGNQVRRLRKLLKY